LETSAAELAASGVMFFTPAATAIEFVSSLKRRSDFHLLAGSGDDVFAFGPNRIIEEQLER
jgi:hypothetical protein